MNDSEPTGDIPLELPEPLTGDECVVKRCEYRVLAQLARGFSNKEIAAELGLTASTVKVYLSRLAERTGWSNRFSMALAFLAGKFVTKELLYARLISRPEPTAVAVARAADKIFARLDQTTIKAPTRSLPAQPDDERWNRIFNERFADPDYYRTRITRSSPLA